MHKNYNLADWLDNKKSDDALRDVQGMDTLKKIKQYSAQLEKPEFSKDEVLRRVKNKQNTKKTKTINWSVAASVLIILGVTSLAFLFSVKDVTSQIDSQQHVVLPDNSKVILAEDSKFKFNNWFWNFDRTAKLSGLAYFEVEKGKTFTVKTDFGTVQVLGTRFQILSRDSVFKVVCYEGSVQVKFEGEENVLKKGQFITYHDRLIFEQSNVYGDKPSWVSQRHHFENVSLSEVMQELEKEYSIEVDILKVTEDKNFTGTLPSDDLSLALEILNKTYQMNYTVINENKFIFVDNVQP